MHAYGPNGDPTFLADARGLVDGVYLAIADSGLKVQVITANTACNIRAVNDSIQTMVLGRGVDAIIGPSCSTSVLAAAPLINQLKVPAITPSGGALAISDAGPYVYRSNTPASGFLKDLMKAVASKYKTMVVVQDSTLLSNDWTRLAVEYYQNNNGSVQDVLVFNADTASPDDARDLVAQVWDVRPHIVYYMSSYGGGDLTTAAFIRELRNRSREYAMVLPNGITSGAMEQLQDSNGLYSYARGILTAGDLPYPLWEDRLAEAFALDHFRDAYGVNYPSAYNAASAIIQAAKLSRRTSPRPEDIQWQLQKPSFSFKAWGGRTARFTPDGDIVQPTQVYAYDDSGAAVPWDPEQ